MNVDFHFSLKRFLIGAAYYPGSCWGKWGLAFYLGFFGITLDKEWEQEER